MTAIIASVDRQTDRHADVLDITSIHYLHLLRQNTLISQHLQLTSIRIPESFVCMSEHGCVPECLHDIVYVCVCAFVCVCVYAIAED